MMDLVQDKLLEKTVKLSYILKQYSKTHLGGENNNLVTCDAYTLAGEPIPINDRHKATEILSNSVVAAEVSWYIMEQEYTLLQKIVKCLLRWSSGVFPEPQGPYYFGFGADKVFSHNIVDALHKASLYAGVNGEVMPGQWDFQVEPAIGISCGDELWIARIILVSITEIAGVVVSFDSKLIEGDWITHPVQKIRNNHHLEDNVVLKALGNDTTQGLPPAAHQGNQIAEPKL